jgi:hypothetical protein
MCCLVGIGRGLQAPFRLWLRATVSEEPQIVHLSPPRSFCEEGEKQLMCAATVTGGGGLEPQEAVSNKPLVPPPILPP